MAQDATYITKTYHERNGDRYVAASGGTIAIESGGSMLMTDSTTINLVAGTALSMESGAVLGLLGADINLTDMRRVLASEWGANVNIGPGTATATNSVLTTSNLPANARIVNLLASLKMSQGSFWMTSVSAGREVFLRCIGDQTGTFTNNNTSIAILRSGCVILGSAGAAVASMHLQTSTNSDTFIYFKAILDNVWAVVAEGGVVSES